MVLPGGRHFIDGGDRDLCFETASDEGAYHPCPSLAIPPPRGGRTNLDLSESRTHGVSSHPLGQFRKTVGVLSRYTPLPEFGRQPTRAPTPVDGAHLDESCRDPVVVQQIELLAACRRGLDVFVWKLPVAQLILKLKPEVVASREQIERDLVGRSLRTPR